jgi:hypothetical protein
MKTSFVVALAWPLLLAGCQNCPAVTPAERVVTQTVNVPVEVARRPPAEVLGCWRILPAEPVFRDAAGGLLLPGSQIAVLEASEAAKRRCDDAWRAWATAP